jgi:hypothetical protein
MASRSFHAPRHEPPRARIGMIMLASIVALLALLNLAASVA